MRPRVDTAPEVDLVALVDVGLLCGALVEGSIAVRHDDLGPVGEDVLLGVGREQSLPVGGLGPVDGASEIGFAALPAALHGLVEGVSPADSSTLHIEQDLLGITLVDKEGRRGPIETSGLFVSLMYHLVVGLVCSS